MNAADIEKVVGLFENVGQTIVKWREDDRHRTITSVKSYKTEADQRAHELIVDGLRKIFPEVSVLSEEGEDRIRPEKYWLIDPIDGTASWYEGFPGFASQAALIEDGLVKFGIVHAPLLERTWWASPGAGAWLNGVRLPKLSQSARLDIVDNYPTPQGIAKQLFEALPATGYKESGSLGIKCCLVADGSADLFVKNVVTRDWDIAPAAPIISEVGGILSLPDGSPYVFMGDMEKNAGVLVARDTNLAEQTMAIIEKFK